MGKSFLLGEFGVFYGSIDIHIYPHYPTITLTFSPGHITVDRILFPRTDLTRVPVETLVRAARKLHTFNINYCKLTDQQKQSLGRK